MEMSEQMYRIIQYNHLQKVQIRNVFIIDYWADSKN